MKHRKIGSLILAGTLAVSLLAMSGCGNQEQPQQEAKTEAATEEKTEAATEETAEAATEETAEAATEETAEAATEETAETAETAAPVFDEIEEIEIYGNSFFPVTDGVEEVEAAINEITEPYGIHIHYHALDVGAYMQQIGLMLSGGERIDLVMDTAMPVTSFSTMLSQKQLMDISDYLPVYAPDMMEFMDEYIGATSVGDAIYGVPCYRVYNGSYYLCFREDILEALDLVEEAANITNWSDYEALMLKVQAAQDTLPEELRTTSMISNTTGDGAVLNVQGAALGSENFADCYGMDVLADNNKIIYVDPATNKVGNFYATDDYRAMIERVHSWYEKDLVYKDSAMNTDGGDYACTNGLVFTWLSPSEIGVEEERSRSTGYPIMCVKVADQPLQSSNANMWAWSVPVTTEAPEAAVAFLNLMYTNPDIENLLVYGIEGRDYDLLDTGEAAVRADAVYNSMDFYYGNQFNAYPSAGKGADFREIALADLKAAEKSPYFGCVIDTNEVANEITAVAAVINKYGPGLASGSVDPAQIDVMLAEMEDAGVQKIIDSYQAQLDAWLAAQ
jgi:putative aldouronate transport system substrate-binding protein